MSLLRQAFGKYNIGGCILYQPVIVEPSLFNCLLLVCDVVENDTLVCSYSLL